MSSVGKPAARIKIANGEAVLGAAVATEELVFSGCNEQRISAVDARSLETRWAIPANGVKPTMALPGYGVLLTGHIKSRRCRAVEVDTGETLWDLSVKRSTALHWRDELLFQTAESGLTRVSVKTGEVLPPLGIETAAATGYTVAGDVLVYRMGESQFGGLDLTENEVLWERPLLAEVEAVFSPPDRPMLTLVAAGDAGLVATWSSRLLGLSIVTGEILWDRVGRVPYFQPNVHEGRVIVWSRDEDFKEHLLCLDAESGSVVYDRLLAEQTSELDGVHQPSCGGVGYGRIAFATREGLLAVYRLSDGQLVLLYRQRAPLFQPAFAGGRLFVPSYDGDLLVFEGDWI